jgi:hypothetical protein
MTVTIDRLVADPSLYLHSIDGHHVRFVELTRDEFRKSIFFDGRIVSGSKVIYRVPLDLMLEVAADRLVDPPRLNFIHHVAQCGSTLLARALDSGQVLGIREPFALRQLGIQAGASGLASSKNWTATLSMVMRFLGKRFEPAGPVVVKDNVPISMIAEAIGKLNPGQAGIVLYFPLDDYLAAVLRTPNHAKWVDSVVNELRLGEDPVVRAAAAALSTPERAAALWLSLIARYDRLIAANSGMRSLDANLLFDRPAETIAAAASHFNIGINAEQAARIASGPLFLTYSKDPVKPYDPAHRIERRAQTMRDHAPAVAEARAWIARRGAEVPVPAALGNPLLGTAPALLRGRPALH